MYENSYWIWKHLRVVIMFGRKLSMGRFFVLKTIHDIHLENPSSEYIEKRLVVDQINLYPDDIKKNLAMSWTPDSLNNLIIKLEDFGLVKSYNVWEKPPKKMLKITKMGKKYLQDAESLYDFHNSSNKKRKTT